jgi:hypothetical protein
MARKVAVTTRLPTACLALVLVVIALQAEAQPASACRLICELEWKVAAFSD